MVFGVEYPFWRLGIKIDELAKILKENFDQHYDCDCYPKENPCTTVFGSSMITAKIFFDYNNSGIVTSIYCDDDFPEIYSKLPAHKENLIVVNWLSRTITSLV